MSGFLKLIIGPMFAGKTTELIELYYFYENKNTLCINHLLDNRYGENTLCSHDNISVPCLSRSTLAGFYDPMDKDYEKMSSANIILINEGQFFPDLFSVVTQLLTDGKTVYIAGLDGDFLQTPIGDILLLVPYCDEIVKKRATCHCGYPAIFSERLCNDNTQILVGISNYRPSCRNCYINQKN